MSHTSLEGNSSRFCGFLGHVIVIVNNIKSVYGGSPAREGDCKLINTQDCTVHRFLTQFGQEMFTKLKTQLARVWIV